MREHSAPSEGAGQAPASLTAAREALGKINMQPNGKRYSNRGAEPSLKRSAKFRSIVPREEVFPLRLLQPPNFSKAKLTGAIRT